jgi:hypothetical protein
MKPLLPKRKHSPIAMQISSEEEKYQTELKSGAEFHVLKKIRLHIRKLKNVPQKNGRPHR